MQPLPAPTEPHPAPPGEDDEYNERLYLRACAVNAAGHMEEGAGGCGRLARGRSRVRHKQAWRHKYRLCREGEGGGQSRWTFMGSRAAAATAAVSSIYRSA